MASSAPPAASMRPASTTSTPHWAAIQHAIASGCWMHTGLLEGLHPELFQTVETSCGPLPHALRPLTAEDDATLARAWACESSRGAPYPELFHFLGRRLDNWIIGPWRRVAIGHATEPGIRRSGASGGVLSRVLIHLLESGQVQGCVVMQQGAEVPDWAKPVIATNREQVLAAAQSVYAVTPTLTILDAIKDIPGKLAMVALPEQAASLRMLQASGHPDALRISVLVGPYTGTNMYHGAVRAFLRGQGIDESAPIACLQWRAGEWPGYLQITMRDGRVFRAEKFYYNYLIPFFVSRHCQLIPDFSNELTDISVGDAWSPAYETDRKGHSVVLARSDTGARLLKEMEDAGTVLLEDVPLAKALAMHGHMLDFKKRGSWLRLQRIARQGHPIPDWGYQPVEIPFARCMVEKVIDGSFTIGRQEWARNFVTRLPIGIVGPTFNWLRLTWKGMSKPTKRKGLSECPMIFTDGTKRWQEIRALAGVSAEGAAEESRQARTAAEAAAAAAVSATSESSSA